MPSVESIIKDIKTLGAMGQEEILNYLEEMIVFMRDRFTKYII